MLVETKQKPISGGGTATWVSTHYNMSFTAVQPVIWPPVDKRPQPAEVVTAQPSPKPSSARALLKYAGTWAGDDIEQRIQEAYATRGKAEF